MALLRALLIATLLFGSAPFRAEAKEKGMLRRLGAFCIEILGGQSTWQLPVRAELPQYAEKNIHWFRAMAEPIPAGEWHRQTSSGTVYLSSPEMLFPAELPGTVRQWILAHPAYIRLTHFAEYPDEIIVEFRLRRKDEGTIRPGSYSAMRLTRSGVYVLADDRLGSPAAPGGLETNYLAEWLHKHVYENRMSFRVWISGSRNERDHFFRYESFPSFLAQLDETGWIVGP